MTHCHFLVPGSLDRPTGGSRYDRAIVEGLRQTGHPVVVHELAGRYPAGDEAAATAVRTALAGIPAGTPTVIDGLVLGSLPTVFAEKARHLPLIGLIHHPLADETGLTQSEAHSLLQQERAALQTVRAVIATSAFTAGRLQTLGLTTRTVQTAPPGVIPGPLSVCRETPTPSRLLCVASLTPRKGQDHLIEALSRITDLAWHATLVGDIRLDPDYAAQVAERIKSLGLGTRMTLTGALDADALERAYQAADVFVLPSHYEGYGMVITEAIARGLPIVTTTGGALATTLPAGSGLAVPPGDTNALATALARILGDPSLYQRLAAGARAARQNLAGWPPTVDVFARLLEEMTTDA